MARTRYLKPGFFTNEHLASHTPWHRLLFAGLWTLADRAGRLEDRPKRIKAALFPYDDDVTGADVDRMLADLSSGADPFVVRYQVSGVSIIQIAKWAQNQTPHRNEVESTLPAVQFAENIEEKSESTTKVVSSTVLVPSDSIPNYNFNLNLKQELETGTGNAPIGAARAPRAKPSHEGFDEAWAAYPRKVSKAKARKAWAAEKPPLQAVLSALEWQCRSRQWQSDGGAYIPHMATWVNQRRWEDEPDARAGPVPVSAPAEPLGAWQDECARLHGVNEQGFPRCGNQHFHRNKVQFERGAVVA